MASNHASRCGLPSALLVRYTLLMKTSYAQKTLSLLRQEFSCLPDSRKTFSISIKDAVMSALAMFSLKTPSLLKFDGELRSSWGQKTLKNLFGVMTTPYLFFRKKEEGEIHKNGGLIFISFGRSSSHFSVS